MGTLDREHQGALRSTREHNAVPGSTRKQQEAPGSISKGVNSRAYDFSVKDSMTDDLYFHAREFSRIFLRIV